MYNDLLERLRGWGPTPPADVLEQFAKEHPWSIEVLCAALEERDQSLRVAAAEALGHIGDERAVRPLTETLRRCFVGGSARRQRVIGVMAVATALVIAAVFGLGLAALKVAVAVSGLVNLVFHIVVHYLKERRSESKLCGAITSALARIAERHPTPELRAVLPDLRAVAADALQHEKETRAASRTAAERIEALTEKLQSLPVPAATPVPDADVLPRAAQAPTPEVESLPRVRY